MAGIGGGEDAGGDFQDAEPDGDEHLLRIAGADLLIDLGQDFTGVQLMLGDVMNEGGGLHHEEGSRDALAGNIADDDTEMVIINEEEVIEVAADLPGGIHGGIDAELVPVREGMGRIGQEAGLDPGGEGELRGDALLLQGEGPALTGGLDVVGDDGGKIEQRRAEGQPEHVSDDPGQIQPIRGQDAEESQAGAEDAAVAGRHAEEEEGRGDEDRGNDKKLNRVRGLGFQIVLQKGLNDIGLVLDAVHGLGLVRRGEIGILQGRGIGADEDDFACPGFGGDLTHNQLIEGEALIEIPGLAGEGDIVMAGGIDIRQAEGLPFALQEEAGALGRHGRRLPAVRIADVEEGMAKDAVQVGHGVDMTLGGDGLQGVIRVDIVDDGGRVQGDRMAILPGDLVPVFRHAGSDHGGKRRGSLGQLIIGSGIGLALIEDIGSDDSGEMIRVRSQLLKGIGHEGAVDRTVGAQLGQGFPVNTDDDDIAGGDAALLIEGVLGPAVQNVDGAGRNEDKDEDGGEEGEEELLNVIHNSLILRSPLTALKR